jgi:hypothetical protein
MVTEVKIIEDSISEAGARLTTFQLKYPRYIHAEVLTHRMFSRNASSSRAIPVGKLTDKSIEEMVTPIRWGLNQPGMQAGEDNLEGDALVLAQIIWTDMAYYCAAGVKRLGELGLHKQWANRPTEWFGHIEVVLTATEWANFYHLRVHPDAQPEIYHLAKLMLDAQNASTPVLRKADKADANNLHLPYISSAERSECSIEDLVRMSTARSCRISYLTHDKQNPEREKDILLHERLVSSEPIHASPTEHIAYPYRDGFTWSANFKGWHQYRKDVENGFK